MPVSESSANAEPRGQASFRTTHWSLVKAAGGKPSEASAKALELLCRSYWFPVYAHIRRRGHGPEEAQDLTQGFFEELLGKNRLERADASRGRFRSFLLASANHYLSHEWEKQNAHKRGRGQKTISLDSLESEDRYELEAAVEASPDLLFDRRWARTILDRVFGVLRAEFDVAGQVKRFDVLKVFLLGERSDLPLADAAARLGMSEPAIKSAVHRLRLRFRDVFRAEIAETIDDAAEVDDEMRHLLRALREG
ncbi:MAG: sigma-70 family RNA polymerase sigma factor [Verrucomicrobiales bacterium]|nr:sigma-70 family RNA polymerase sigma factor [Verrucomicrobiales bacterium]